MNDRSVNIRVYVDGSEQPETIRCALSEAMVLQRPIQTGDGKWHYLAVVVTPDDADPT